MILANGIMIGFQTDPNYTQWQARNLAHKKIFRNGCYLLFLHQVKEDQYPIQCQSNVSPGY